MSLVRTTTLLAATATLVAGVGALAPAAQASGGSTATITRGACSGSSTWKLKAKPDNGKLEISFEVDSNVNGQAWAVRISDNGTSVFSGTRRTQAPSGSFSVTVRTADRAGTDTVRASATNAATGETCSGSLTR